MNSSDSINFVEKCINYIIISKALISSREFFKKSAIHLVWGKRGNGLISRRGPLHATHFNQIPEGMAAVFPSSSLQFYLLFPNISSLKYTPLVILKKIKNGDRMTYTSLKNFIDQLTAIRGSRLTSTTESLKKKSTQTSDVLQEW